jgi:hypothetical protein
MGDWAKVVGASDWMALQFGSAIFVTRSAVTGPPPEIFDFRRS